MAERGNWGIFLCSWKRKEIATQCYIRWILKKTWKKMLHIPSFERALRKSEDKPICQSNVLRKRAFLFAQIARRVGGEGALILSRKMQQIFLRRIYLHHSGNEKKKPVSIYPKQKQARTEKKLLLLLLLLVPPAAMEALCKHPNQVSCIPPPRLFCAFMGFF